MGQTSSVQTLLLFATVQPSWGVTRLPHFGQDMSPASYQSSASMSVWDASHPMTLSPVAEHMSMCGRILTTPYSSSSPVVPDAGAHFSEGTILPVTR